jgi:hypothetical protein
MRSALRILFLLPSWAALRPTPVAWAQSGCASPGKHGPAFSATPNPYYPGVARRPPTPPRSPWARRAPGLGPARRPSGPMTCCSLSRCRAPILLTLPRPTTAVASELAMATCRPTSRPVRVRAGGRGRKRRRPPFAHDGAEKHLRYLGRQRHSHATHLPGRARAPVQQLGPDGQQRARRLGWQHRRPRSARHTSW